MPEPVTKISKLPPLSHQSNSAEDKHPSIHFNIDLPPSLTPPNKECGEEKPDQHEATDSKGLNADENMENPEGIKVDED